MIDDYELEGWTVKKVDQGGGLWTIIAQSPAKPTNTQPTNPTTNSQLPKPKPAPASSNKKWRVAASLITLLRQVDILAPNRSKKSDGTIGDAAHQSSKSDHNPHVKDGNQGVVTALDITHDRAHGCDCQKIVNSLVASQDPRIKYIIWKKEIVSSKIKPWVWRKYNGSNPHSKHLHLSVMGSKSEYDSTDSWNLFEINVANVVADQEIAWGGAVSKAFKKKVIKIAAGLEVDPSDLMSVMAFESARTFRPDIQNPITNATGLIQFMPKTAKGLDTSIGELKAMTAIKQLDYVERYMKPHSGKLKDIFDLYMAVLWPAAIGKPNSFILFSQTHKPKAYKANKGLDQNDDGAVTKAEAAGKVINHLHEGLRDSNLG